MSKKVSLIKGLFGFLMTIGLVFGASLPAWAFNVSNSGGGTGGSGGGGSTRGIIYKYWVGEGDSNAAVNGIMRQVSDSTIYGINRDLSRQYSSVPRPAKTACDNALRKVGKGGKVVALAVTYNRSTGPSLYRTNPSDFVRNTTGTRDFMRKVEDRFSTKKGYKAGLATAIKNSAKSVGRSELSVHCVAASSPDLTKGYNMTVPFDLTLESEINAVYDQDIVLEGQYLVRGNWKNQKKTELTPYGKKLVELEKKYKGKELTASQYNKVKSELEAAIKKGKTSNLKISMTERNQKVFANGGVVNVIERDNYKTANIGDNRSGTLRLSGCTNTSKTKAQANKEAKEKMEKAKHMGYGSTGVSAIAQDIKKTYSCATHSFSHNANTYTFTSDNPTTPGNSGFWQMLSVHCNKAGFEELYNRTNGATIINTGDDSKEISAVMHSKVYPSEPSVKDFPHTNNRDGFFDKECPYDCTPDPALDVAKMNEARVNNTSQGAVENDKSTGLGTGATSEGIQGNYFTFFRDNDPKELKIDLWYPVPGSNGGVVKYDGDKAITTTITRWGGGTPGITGQDGGQFSMWFDEVKNSNKVFGKGLDPKSQRNWDNSTDTTSLSRVLPGQHTDFFVASTWASKAGAPQVLNFKWEYDPDVSTKFPALNLGFNKDYTQRTGDIVTVATPIQGKCYASFGTRTSKDTVGLFNEYTGTNTVNELDAGPINVEEIERAGKVTEDQGWKESTNLIINFVRATTE